MWLKRLLTCYLMRLVHLAIEILCRVFHLQDTWFFIDLFNRNDCYCTWLICIDFLPLLLYYQKPLLSYFFKDKIYNKIHTWHAFLSRMAFPREFSQPVACSWALRAIPAHTSHLVSVPAAVFLCMGIDPWANASFSGTDCTAFLKWLELVAQEPGGRGSF